MDYHPVFVNGIQTVELEYPPVPGWSSYRTYGVHDLPGCTSGPGVNCEKVPGAVSGIGAAGAAGVITPDGSLPFDESQTMYCASDGACSYGTNVWYGWKLTGMKLTGIRSGQRLEVPVRYTGLAATANGGSLGSLPVLPKEPNLGEAFTALIRYSNCRTTPASASLAVSGSSGMGRTHRLGDLAVDDPGRRHVLRHRRELHLAPGLPRVRLHGGHRPRSPRRPSDAQDFARRRYPGRVLHRREDPQG